MMDDEILFRFFPGWNRIFVLSFWGRKKKSFVCSRPVSSFPGWVAPGVSLFQKSIPSPSLSLIPYPVKEDVHPSVFRLKTEKKTQFSAARLSFLPATEKISFRFLYDEAQVGTNFISPRIELQRQRRSVGRDEKRSIFIICITKEEIKKLSYSDIITHTRHITSLHRL